ncbi:hypothetical protein DXG01_016059, partial [Tephrocybe rancida]
MDYRTHPWRNLTASGRYCFIESSAPRSQTPSQKTTKKPNPFVDLEAEVDAQDERDLDEAGADNEF